ncbi:TatD family hydrolase [Litoribrevibacter albus]|uniref:Deoxyribonuclease n=1 Tax=Litoribrevibacter albus TaxID=1473156 RepID=A0AA37SBQ6_9GAMM|nr:TatD family hydrolase [Litoribrevibacter albus]GLQ33232.1 deoxyribonuclease [Litoribrevibacter albus]
MRYFDTHCHLDFEVFDSSLESLLVACRSSGIDRFVIPGTRVSSIPKIRSIQKQNEGVYVAFGIHPFFVDDDSLSDLPELERNLISAECDPSLVAVGEIGLDRFCDADYELQCRVFEAQLALALKLGLPVILHNRKSDQRILDALTRYPVKGGVVHGFSGSYETAMRFIDRGFKIGIGGVVTWENARKVRDMVVRLPLDAIVLETDAPDMSPQWAKGQVNSPSELPAIARYLSELKKIDLAMLCEQLYRNSCELFFD